MNRIAWSAVVVLAVVAAIPPAQGQQMSMQDAEQKQVAILTKHCNDLSRYLHDQEVENASLRDKLTKAQKERDEAKTEVDRLRQENVQLKAQVAATSRPMGPTSRPAAQALPQVTSRPLQPLPKPPASQPVK